MEKHYKYVLLGATFFACQFAVAVRDNLNKNALDLTPKRSFEEKSDILILENSILTGNDFCIPLTPCEIKSSPQLHIFGSDFLKEAKERKMDKSPLALPNLLSKMILKYEIPLLFGTKILSIEKIEGIFNITIFTEQGYITLKADNVIDTTSGGYHLQNPANCITTLSAVTEGFLPENMPSDIKNTFNLGKLPIISAVCNDFAEGRKKLFNFVHQNENLIILTFAKALGYNYEKPFTTTFENGVIFIPSASFLNPFDAMIYGFNFANQLENGGTK